MKKFRWEKRLKWLRLSKMVIPIALAISLIFIGFTVYADEAQNFVVRVQQEGDIKLSLTSHRDLSNQTSVLSVPFTGHQTNTTYEPDETFTTQSENQNRLNIPNDIALGEGASYGEFSDEEGTNRTYAAFSFWLVNNSERAVDVDMVMNLDGLVTYSNDYDHHIDDVLRIMVVEGETLLYENGNHNYTIFAKEEDPNHPYHPDSRTEDVSDFQYPYKAQNFSSATEIFKWNMLGFEPGATKKYTIVFWLEGWDEQCTNHIYGERAKLSIDFIGH